MGDPLEEIVHRFQALDFQAEFSKYLGLQRGTEVSNRICKETLIAAFHPKALSTRHSIFRCSSAADRRRKDVWNFVTGSRTENPGAQQGHGTAKLQLWTLTMVNGNKRSEDGAINGLSYPYLCFFLLDGLEKEHGLIWLKLG